MDTGSTVTVTIINNLPAMLTVVSGFIIAYFGNKRDRDRRDEVRDYKMDVLHQQGVQIQTTVNGNSQSLIDGLREANARLAAAHLATVSVIGQHVGADEVPDAVNADIAILKYNQSLEDPVT